MTKEQPISWEENAKGFLKQFMIQCDDPDCEGCEFDFQAVLEFISQQRKEEREKVIDEFIFIREEGERHLADDIIEMIILQSTCSHDSFYWNKEKCICEQCFKVLSALTEPS